MVVLYRKSFVIGSLINLELVVPSFKILQNTVLIVNESYSFNRTKRQLIVTGVISSGYTEPI